MDNERINEPAEAERQKCRWSGAGMTTGAAVGVTFGLVFDNLAVGIALGTAIGVVFDFGRYKS
ncbi:MAG: hypothetical protein FWE32_03055 [Oscillospiraceae bacterium]|nr:hypothetical protein [Oscillospiraceae bacterium]